MTWDRAWARLQAKCDPATAKRARLKEDRHRRLWELARAAPPGASAEVGVFRGAGSFIICDARPEGEHHCFDSFAGLSPPDPPDRVGLLPSAWPAGEFRADESIPRANLRGFGDRVHFWPGWIPTRFHKVCCVRWAFVHIDVDFWQPTRDSICFFGEAMAPGGIIVSDDYGSPRCPGARCALDEWARRTGHTWRPGADLQAFCVF